MEPDNELQREEQRELQREGSVAGLLAGLVTLVMLAGSPVLLAILARV